MCSDSGDGVVEWHPGCLLQKQPADKDHDFALIVLNQPLKANETLDHLWRCSSYRVAADGGANRLFDVQEKASVSFDNLDVIIGDLDSLADEARDHFASTQNPAQVIHEPDQYSTDFAKAVTHIRRSRPSLDIVALGGLGGRVDQGLSQLHHLYLFQTDPQYTDGRVYLLSGESITFLLKRGKHRIRVPMADREVFGKHVGIIPIREPSVISTKGLEWDVTDWKTEFGGQMSTSNHILPETEVIEIQTDKDVLFTIALRREEGYY